MSEKSRPAGDGSKYNNRHEPKDAILRQWIMLRLIPRAPQGITARELRQKLSEIDPLYDVHRRTIERNLWQLSSVFQTLGCEERQPGGARWYWEKDTVMDVPRLDAKTALMFRLAEAHLTPILPRVTVDELRPHFLLAEKTLREIGEYTYSRWPDKVKVIQNSIRLRQPEINPEVLSVVHDALFEDRRFQSEYRVRSGERRDYEINPRGMVFRDGIVYAVCTLGEEMVIRHLPLHRMLSVQLLEKPVLPLPGFRLDEYVKTYFDYPLRALQANAGIRDSIPDTLPLRIAMNPMRAVHLKEAPLADDQLHNTLPDGRVVFLATVANTERLRWWLLSYGDGVEVLEPPALREEIRAMAERMLGLYAEEV